MLFTLPCARSPIWVVVQDCGYAYRLWDHVWSALPFGSRLRGFKEDKRTFRLTSVIEIMRFYSAASPS